MQGSNYLFRNNPRKFRQYFQQLEDMGERCKLPHCGFRAKMLSKCKKIVYSVTLFGVRYKRIVEPKQKNVNRNFVFSPEEKSSIKF